MFGFYVFLTDKHKMSAHCVHALYVSVHIHNSAHAIHLFTIVSINLLNQPVDNAGKSVHHAEPDSEYAYLWK